MTFTGRVYQVICDCCGRKYVGSTKQTLAQRMTQHRIAAKRKQHIPLYNHMNEAGIDKFRIVRLELVDDCVDKEQLRMHEQRYIDQLQPELNQKMAYQTVERRKEYEARYREAHAD